MKPSVEELLYRFFIKYESLTNLTREAFSNTEYQDSKNANIYINLSEIVRYIYKNQPTLDQPNALVSAILNMVAHYKHFYRSRCNVDTKIYLIYSEDTFNHESYPCYDMGYNKLRAVNSQITDFVEFNLGLLKELYPYLPDIYFFRIKGFEAGLAIADLIIHSDNPNPNIIISTAEYDFQIPATIDHLSSKYAVVFKAKKNGSYICCTKNNAIASYIYSTRGTTQNNIPESQLLLGLLMALSNYPNRGLKSILNIDVAISQINQAISNYIISGNDFVSPQSMKEICQLKNINEIEIMNRYRSIDINCMLSIYWYSAYTQDRSFIIDNYDPKGVQEINNTYFKNNPIDLNRL